MPDIILSDTGRTVTVGISTAGDMVGSGYARYPDAAPAKAKTKTVKAKDEAPAKKPEPKAPEPEPDTEASS